MLGFPDMRLAGLKGLMELALRQGDRETALRHAEAAYGQTRAARWAWRALLDARLEAADWTAALDLVKSALDRKIVPPVVAERARAALLAALASQLEHAPEPKARAQALDHALDAARLEPGFAPGVVMAARLLAQENKLRRAEDAIEHLGKSGRRLEGWEGWVKFADGSRTHSLRHPGSFVLPTDGPRAAAVTLENIRKAQETWDRSPEYPGAALYFCLTVAPA